VVTAHGGDGGGADDGTLTVRAAGPDAFLDVMRVLEGALVDVAPGTVRDALAAGEVCVAEREGTVVGAVVLVDPPAEAPLPDDAAPAADRTPATDARDLGRHVAALAVRRRDRRRGIGHRLLVAAAEGRERLSADCRPEVAGFYEAAGFEVTRRDGRAWGVWTGGGSIGRDRSDRSDRSR
jgi:GNAT superfamily N-acetyltransferase